MLDKYQPSKDRVVGFPYRQGTMGPLKSGSKTSKKIFSSGSQAARHKEYSELKVTSPEL